MSKETVLPPAPGLLDDHVSREDCARQLGTSSRTLQRWEAQGKGPPVAKIGKVPWYSIERTKAWILEQARVPVRAAMKPRARKRQGRGRP